MKESIKEIISQRTFIVGLALRLLLIGLCVPATQVNWFVPFVEHWVAHPSIDPWTTFLRAGGDPLAFPYGPIMLFAYLPGVAGGYLIDSLLGTTFGASIGFGLTTLTFDFGLLVCLRRLLNVSPSAINLFYWFSPIVLYVCYWHGQTDVVPVALLIASLLLLKEQRPALSGVLFGISVAAKLNILLAAPVVLIYLGRNARMKPLFMPFLQMLVATLAVTQLPPLLSDGFWQMTIGSREVKKVYNLTVSLGGGGNDVYVLPLVYSFMLYLAWRIERMSFELLFALVGISFFSVVTLTPASSGWYLWLVPFIAAFQISAGGLTSALGTALSIVYLAAQFLFSTGALIRGAGIDLRNPILIAAKAGTHPNLHALLLTALSALSVLFALRMFIHGVRRTKFFRASRRPFAIAVAGDSGTGKDTLARALTGLFGEECVTNIFGDDYHKWNRQAPMWQALTHLDPRANDLLRLTRDVQSLLDGHRVAGRHYDHETGRFLKGGTLLRNNVILVTGLHALFIPQLREKMDVRVFLDMDEALRCALKIRRDVGERKKPEAAVRESIEKRLPDTQKFIRPQAEHADIVFSLLASDAENVEQCISLDRYKLKIVLRSGIFYEDLAKALVAICGAHVDMTLSEGGRTIELIVEGEIAAEDIAISAREVVEELGELTALKPVWQGGMLGVMQLTVLYQMLDSVHSKVVTPQYAYA